MKAKLICNVCMQVIGIFDTDTIQLPLTAEQFESFDPVHSFPPPFQPGQIAQYMVCFYCRHRPFYIKEGDTDPERIFMEPPDGKREYFVFESKEGEQSDGSTQERDRILNAEGKRLRDREPAGRPVKKRGRPPGSRSKKAKGKRRKTSATSKANLHIEKDQQPEVNANQ